MNGRSSAWKGKGGLWLGAIALLSSLAGTLLIKVEVLRLLGVALLIAAAVLAILAWGQMRWQPAFTPDPESQRHTKWDSRLIQPSVGFVLSALLALISNVAYVISPGESLGSAGWLWLGGIALLLVSAHWWNRIGSTSKTSNSVVQIATTLPVRLVEPVEASNNPKSSIWPRWEIATLAGLTLIALALRVWNLRAVPDNIYPDEIMTGQVAAQAYLSGQPAPSLFSTLWGGIDLPALWFFIVSRFQMWGGQTLEMLRLPAALFGAATVLPFYGLARGVWGRWSAIGGTAILAVSASNINYSRLALNNIVAPFFWTLCFFFLLRALRQRKPLDWALAGLSAGLSEHFYNGTRLLPFILTGFLIFLLIFYWRQVRTLIGGYALLALGYLIGFGPLLAHFLRNPNLYLGRGNELLVWKGGVPTSLDEVGQMWNTLAPLVGDNLLGFSTAPSQDIMYFAPLLLVPEAALLVLGFALLVWQWRHPAAFIVLLSGLGTLFVGGTLISYPNSAFPQINHWTPAFPAIYIAIAITIGALATYIEARLPTAHRWVVPASLPAVLVALALWNVGFYFSEYKTDADVLKSESYRRAQNYYDAQTAQSRYIASLGKEYRVVWVGGSAQPYDAQTTYYLMGASEDGVRVTNPESELPGVSAGGKELAFILFPENEQYRALVEAHYPGGEWGEVRGATGKHIFFTYEVRP